MARTRKSSIRSHYFGSYLGIVFCACMLIGLLVLGRALLEIQDASRDDYQEKMSLAANELQSQQEILESIAYRIKATAIYRPFFTSRNPYYEVEIVDDIGKFRAYSPLVDEYYYVQLDTGSVFSDAGKLTIDQFERYRLHSESGFVDDLLKGDSFRILDHPSLPDTLLFSLSFRMQQDGRHLPNTVLLFLVPRAQMAERLSLISALDVSHLTVYWQDFLILRGDEADEISDESSVLSVASENGDFRILSSMEPPQLYQRLDDFRHYILGVLVAATCLLLTLAAYVAHRSFQPVDRLLARLNVPHNGSAKDIEGAVKALQDSNHTTAERLQSRLIDVARQRREIAKQLLFVKLSGAHDTQLDTLLSEAGIVMDHPLFCVVLLGVQNAAEGEESLSAIVRSLQDDDLNLYSAGVYQGQYAILLMNFIAREQLEETCKILRESLEVQEKGATLYVGDICEEMGQLPVSFVTALSRREAQQAGDQSPRADSEVGWYDDRQFRLMMQALREGDALKAQTCLTEAVRVLDEKYPSMLLKRCIWADVGNQLLKTSKAMEVPLDPTSLQILMMSVDSEGFHQQLSAIVEGLVAAFRERTEQESRHMEHAVVHYIEERLFSPQFTITEAADHFGVSERKVGNIVRHVTGMGYKEFIIKLRMERAKTLLTAENRNVSQTSESVGYNNIPYFIKTFRSYTGYTPGEYKKLFDQPDSSGQEDHAP